MIPILTACLIWIPALVGLGSPLATALRRSSGAITGPVAVRTAVAGLLGMFVASTVSAAANFFLPVYPWVSTAILLAGWLLLARDHRRWRRLPRSAWQLFGAIVFMIALIDARGLSWYDTGLYHLQAVQWITTTPLPRGLANLHGRLGFNCSWFPLAAATETPLALGKSCFIVNALLAILIALPAVDALLRRSAGPVRSDRVVLILMLIPLALFGVDQAMISSLAPDLVVMLLVLFSVSLWVRSPRFAPCILTLACFAMTIKLSAAPLLLIALLMTALSRRWLGMAATAFCAVAGIIALFRGIWLSGYPAFPSPLGRILEVSWTSPPRIALHAAREIEFWSKYRRVYEAVQPGTPWIGNWAHRLAMSQPMLIAYGLSAMGIALWIYRKPRWTPAARRCLIAGFLLIPATAFWFFTAPQVRFGYGFIYGIASLGLAMGLGGSILPSMAKRTRQFAMAAGITLLLLCFRIDRHLLKIPLLRWPEIPTANLEPHRMMNGVIVWMPTGDDRVWDAPLPATPELDPLLQCDLDKNGHIRQFRFESPGDK